MGAPVAATLFGMTYSPWTERARWALDYHRVEYGFREHVPFLGERLLRFRARSAQVEKPTVPLWVADGQAVVGSFAIMKVADGLGDGGLQTDDPEVAAWAERIEPALGMIRRRVTRSTLGDPAALKEAATAAAPASLAGLLRPVAAMGARYIAKKYEFDADAPEPQPDLLRSALDDLRRALGDRGHVVGERFTAADIIGATLLQGVRPVEGFMEVGPETRRMWHDPALAARCEDLLAWRDAIYAAHRRR
jgi:glutathione S-transferase